MNSQVIKQYIEDNNLEEASKLINDLEKNGKLNVEIISMKVVILILQNNFKEALDWTTKGLAENQENSDLLYNLGYIYQQLEELYKAKEYYSLALNTCKNQENKAVIEASFDSISQIITEQEFNAKPLVSIVMLAYNNLFYSKLCVESILEFTKHINYEFILVNNGSSDGTREFFDSIKGAKVKHLFKNVGPANGFNVGIDEAKGKYIACVCNDFVFTPRWMDNLLTCIESDERIGFVSPGSSNISNHQWIAGNYSNIGEVIEFAEQYNHSDSSKWEERVRLLPCVLMVRAEVFRNVGKYDPQFYYGEFADDDISFRIRRAGYKLIYCKDTFTYHFGSITTRDDHINNDSLRVSREIFRNKHGLDAWDDGLFSNTLVKNFQLPVVTGLNTILGVNMKCGATPLQLKNRLRENGHNHVHITNYSTDPKYMVDLQTVSNIVIQGNVEEIGGGLKKEKFNYVLLEQDFDLIENDSFIIGNFLKMLEEDGQLGMIIRMKQEQKSFEKLIQRIEKEGATIISAVVEKWLTNENHLIITAKRG